MVEVSHEALIRHWERLRAWIDENRANLRTRADLAADRDEWLKHGQRADLLIPPGLRLEAARRCATSPATSKSTMSRTISRHRSTPTSQRKHAAQISGSTPHLADENDNAADAERLRPTSSGGVPWSGPFGTWPACPPRCAMPSSVSLPTDHQIEDPSLAPARSRAFGLRPEADGIQRLWPGPRRDPTDHRPRQLQALAQAVQTLGPTPEQAQAALGPVLDAIRQTTDPTAPGPGPGRPDPRPQARPEQAQAALGPVLDAIRQTTDPSARGPGPGRPDPRTQARPSRPRPPSAPSSTPSAKTTDADQLEALAQAVQTLGPKLTPEQAQAALARPRRHPKDHHPDTAPGPGPGRADPRAQRPSRPRPPLAPSKKLRTAQLRPRPRPLRGPRPDASRQTRRSARVQAVPDALPTALAQAVQPRGPARALAGPGRPDPRPKLTPEQAQAALGPVLDAIRQTTDPDQLQALAQAVQTLGPSSRPSKPRPPSAPSSTPSPTSDPYRLRALAQAVQTLGPSSARAGPGRPRPRPRRHPPDHRPLPAPGPGPGRPDPRPHARAGPGRPRPGPRTIRQITDLRSAPVPGAGRPAPRAVSPAQAQAALNRSSTPSARPPTPTSPGPGSGRPDPWTHARARAARPFSIQVSRTMLARQTSRPLRSAFARRSRSPCPSTRPSPILPPLSSC